MRLSSAVDNNWFNNLFTVFARHHIYYVDNIWNVCQNYINDMEKVGHRAVEPLFTTIFIYFINFHILLYPCITGI